MSVFSSVFRDLVSPTRGGKLGFPKPACRPDVPGDPPKVKIPDGFCKTGPDIKRALDSLVRVRRG